MKKTLLATILIALTFILACKVTVPIVNGSAGCWYEKEVGRIVYGFAEEYNPKDSTYIMRTYDGWAMKVKSLNIKWK